MTEPMGSQLPPQQWEELLDKEEQQELIEGVLEDAFNRERGIRPRSPDEIKELQTRLRELNNKKLQNKEST